MNRNEWVWVPREPTEAMHKAMPEVSMYVAIDRFRRDFGLMLAAAPPPPAEQASVEHVETLINLREWWIREFGAYPPKMQAMHDAAIAALSQQVVDEAMVDLFMSQFNCEAENTTGTRLYEPERGNVLNALTAVLAPQQPEKGEG